MVWSAIKTGMCREQASGASSSNRTFTMQASSGCEVIVACSARGEISTCKGVCLQSGPEHARGALKRQALLQGSHSLRILASEPMDVWKRHGVCRLFKSRADVTRTSDLPGTPGEKMSITGTGGYV